MRMSNDQKYIFLADCENPGNFSNCNLRVLSELEQTTAKINYTIKINGVLKEFDVLDIDMVVALTNDNKIQIYIINGETYEQVTDLGSILPVNSASKLCNLHVCPKSKLIGLSVCTTKAIGMDPVYEKIMLFCLNKKITDPVSGKFRVELKKLYHMELKLFAKPT